MKQNTKEAFSEVYEIFKIMPEEIVNKIPKSFYNMIKEGRDKEYKLVINKPISNEKLKIETMMILGLIYRDFLTERDEKKVLQTRDNIALKKLQNEIEKEMREKYNPDDIFKNRNKTIDKYDEIIEEKALTVTIQKEKWYKKLWNMVRKIIKNY